MEQPDLLRFTVETLERLRIPYLVVGSFASSIWGEPRFTNDIDILIELGLGQIATFCQAFPFPEFYVSEVAAAEAGRLRDTGASGKTGNPDLLTRAS